MGGEQLTAYAKITRKNREHIRAQTTHHLICASSPLNARLWMRNRILGAVEQLHATPTTHAKITWKNMGAEDTSRATPTP